MKPLILHVGKGYWPNLGGMETITRQLAEGAVKEGFEVKVLAFGANYSRETLNSVEIIWVPTLFNFGRAPISHLFRRIFNDLLENADIVHFHCPNPLTELVWLTMTPGIRKKKFCVCSYQSDPLKPVLLLPFYKILTRAFLGSCNRIAASSEQYRDSSPLLRGFKDKVRVIPLGVDTTDNLEVSEQNRTKMGNILSGLPSPRILFAGRFVYYKGLEYLLRAVGKVKGISCILIGDGPRRKELEKLAGKLGISERVLFPGHLEESLYRAVFERSDLFVLPSVYRTEAFGLVALEAMAAGMPLITTEIGTATSVYNMDGVTGYVVPPFHVSMLAERIKDLAFNAELRNRMGKNAYDHVRKNYSSEMMIEKYLDLYRYGKG